MASDVKGYGARSVLVPTPARDADENPMTGNGVKLRSGAIGDAEDIAALHADSGAGTIAAPIPMDSWTETCLTIDGRCRGRA